MQYILVLIITVLISGCTTIDITQYTHNQPTLNIYTYFQGETKGWGIVQDRKGRLTRQFVVKINGRVNSGNDLVLEEYFDWSDGEKSSRTWTIAAEGANKFRGIAEDVVGVAKGSAYGNALHWQYYLKVLAGKSTWKIHLDDWMFLQPDNILINKTTMSKFGLHVGDITIVFRKDIGREV